jgi:hypothetical protein
VLDLEVAGKILQDIPGLGRDGLNKIKGWLHGVILCAWFDCVQGFILTHPPR